MLAGTPGASQQLVLTAPKQPSHQINRLASLSQALSLSAKGCARAAVAVEGGCGVKEMITGR